MTYTEWLKRPESERDAEAATVVMGWRAVVSVHNLRQYKDADGDWRLMERDFHPCTDRNATDMLLAQLRSRPLSVQFSFDDALSSAIGEDEACDMMWLEFLSLSPSLLTWACVEACKGDAS